MLLVIALLFAFGAVDRVLTGAVGAGTALGLEQAGGVLAVLIVAFSYVAGTWERRRARGGKR